VVAYCLLTGRYPVPAERDHLEQRRTVFTADFSLPCHVSAAARSLVSRLLTPEPRHRLSSVLKLSREAWYMRYDLEAVRGRRVPARDIYERHYPADAEDLVSDSGEFIDFDATTVDDILGNSDDILGNSERVEEFPLLPARPEPPATAAVTASTPCRAVVSPDRTTLTLSPGSTDSVLASNEQGHDSQKPGLCGLGISD